jgi:hypothetical protein
VRVLAGFRPAEPGRAGPRWRLARPQAADTLYALVSDDVYRLLVVDRRWPAEAWKTWT